MVLRCLLGLVRGVSPHGLARASQAQGGFHDFKELPGGSGDGGVDEDDDEEWLIDMHRIVREVSISDRGAGSSVTCSSSWSRMSSCI
mmetsp:Transcript_160551/g.490787  ORF Transcript_160551/g.490787 Transcript_160551/m.490787 type:complete len:87 (-) Transcript_160551:62-322(-)